MLGLLWHRTQMCVHFQEQWGWFLSSWQQPKVWSIALIFPERDILFVFWHVFVTKMTFAIQVKQKWDLLRKISHTGKKDEKPEKNTVNQLWHVVFCIVALWLVHCIWLTKRTWSLIQLQNDGNASWHCSHRHLEMWRRKNINFFVCSMTEFSNLFVCTDEKSYSYAFEVRLCSQRFFSTVKVNIDKCVLTFTSWRSGVWRTSPEGCSSSGNCALPLTSWESQWCLWCAWLWNPDCKFVHCWPLGEKSGKNAMLDSYTKRIRAAEKNSLFSAWKITVDLFAVAALFSRWVLCQSVEWKQLEAGAVQAAFTCLLRRNTRRCIYWYWLSSCQVAFVVNLAALLN